MQETLSRIRSARTLSVSVLVVALAGLGAALTLGHNLNSLAIVGAIVIATVLGAAVIFGSLYFSLLGSRWTLYFDRLILRRPGAQQLVIPRENISAVRIESIAGFGLVDPICVVVDRSGTLLFWTVASRWSADDLKELWTKLGVEPTDARTHVEPFETMPYDRRY